jgi:hypothetical protein
MGCHLLSVRNGKTETTSGGTAFCGDKEPDGALVAGLSQRSRR